MINTIYTIYYFIYYIIVYYDHYYFYCIIFLKIQVLMYRKINLLYAKKVDGIAPPSQCIHSSIALNQLEKVVLPLTMFFIIFP